MKQTHNLNTLTNLTELLNGNRGIAEKFLSNVSGYVDAAVESGEMKYIDTNNEEELEGYFCDVAADAYEKDDEVYDLITALGALNHQYSNRISDSYGYLARLMVEYYRSEYGGINESKTKRKNMKKNTIKLNESQLRQIVAESMKKVLKEEQTDTDSEIYQAIVVFLNELHRIIMANNGTIEDYDEEIRNVQQSAIKLRDALIMPKQRRRGISQGDLTFNDIS